MSGSSASDSPPIVLFTRSLDRAGAERQLVNLAVALHRQGQRVHVAALLGGGPLEQEVSAEGIPIDVLATRATIFFAPLKLALLTWKLRPLVVY